MEIPLGIFEEITGMGLLPAPVDEADHERRKHQRAPFGFRGMITYNRKGGEEISSIVMVRDISMGGLSFLNEDTMKPGTPFVMEFKGHEDRPVQIRCSVQRCATGGLEETEHIIGATFEELLTKELERPKPEPKPAEPPPETLATAENPEELAAQMIAGDDVAQAEAIKEVAPQPVVPEGTPAAPQPAPAAQAAPAPQPAPAAEATPTPAPAPAPTAPAAPAAAAPTPAAPAPSAPAAAAPAAAATAAPAAPKPGGLFGGAAPIPKRRAEVFPSEDEVGKPAAPAKPAPTEDKGPVFRDVPLPDPAPAPVKISQSFEGGSSEPIHFPVGAGKTHEVLARAKEMLVRQEHTIKKQQEQLRELRDNSSKEVQALRAEVADMRKQLAEFSARTQADDQAISDLASFLEKHNGSENSDERESEAA